MTNSLIEAAKGKLGQGIQALAANQSSAKTPELLITLINIKTQIRKEFEDTENPLSELADDIKMRGILQPILVRPVQGGKYELVAGERRLRAAKMVGLKTIPAFVKAMSDEEAEQAQFIENIRRKNLTLQEEAQRIQRDLDACGGDVEAVLKKYGKPKSGRVWIYKMRGLLNLSDQAQRLISENITADMEVINDVRQIEKVSPAKAKETVDKLKAASTTPKSTNKAKEAGKPAGKSSTGDMREISRSAKAEVVPSKRQAKKTEETKAEQDGGIIATSRNREAKEPGPVTSTVFPSAPAPAPVFAWLDKAAKGEELADSEEAEREKLEKSLRGFFDKGTKAEDWVTAIAEGIRQKSYDDSVTGRLNLAAFSAGFAKSEDFNMSRVINRAQNL
jgi:ParB family transcriptional regulator, chromosome partitioning protein